MDKKIEEMTKETCGQQIYPYGKDRPICWLTKEDCTCRADNQCDHYEVCERIYNAGYRKIPEGAVVLTREEYTKSVVKVFHSSKEERIKLWAKAYNQGSKETAEKFAEMVSKAFIGLNCIDVDEWNWCQRKIDENCKELVDE